MTNREIPELPGDVLKLRLDLLGKTQASLAEVLGRTQPWVSDLVKGRKAITIRSATELGAVFGTGPGYWLMLRDKRQLWEVSQDAAHVRNLEQISKRAAEQGF